MSAIEKVDWDTVDFDLVVGDYIEMPDGTQHYIEMTMLHWYWLDFMGQQEVSVQEAVKMAENVLKDCPDANFDDVLRLGLLAWGREWTLQTEGR